MRTAHDLVAAAKARVQEIPVTEVDQAIREADEFAACHLAGAVHMSHGAGRSGPA